MASDPTVSPKDLDVLIVGAGFSGIYQLHHLRSQGFSVKVVEAGSDMGGTWYWNCYPGARVDSEHRMYQLSIDEIWKDWDFSCKFPDWKELRQYFYHADKNLGLRRDIRFNTRVIGAEFDDQEHRWSVTTHTGEIIRPRFLSMCTGFASKAYVPPIKGLKSFQGICHHTSLWPQEGVDLRDKRIGVVGTGASGVQVFEEAAKVAQHVTIFQRTPNYALPMNQEIFDGEAQRKFKEKQAEAFMIRRTHPSGHDIPYVGEKMSEMTPRERQEWYEGLWTKGGFHVSKGGFSEVGFNEEANDWVYGFWRDKVRQRIHDPRLKEKLAPQIKPHPFNTKRLPLEQTYYDAFNQPNTSLIDVNETPISEVTSQGIKTSDGKEHKFDIIVLATGFDSVTGSLTQIDIKSTEGVPLREKWSSGLKTHLGMMTAGFPNMFFVYGAHGVTAFGNGPTCLEQQSDWIVQCLKDLRDLGATRIDPTNEAEGAWTHRVNDLCAKGLWMKAKSWWTGANIPGKKVECLSFPGGLPLYTQLCQESAANGYKGFLLSAVAPNLVINGNLARL
ncbi:hypothetical protein EYR40_009564 [Pleurotus pulmonarius]|nr:hypothetical protein EYR40_009564 [Pleurotus pulmonarius]